MTTTTTSRQKKDLFENKTNEQVLQDAAAKQEDTKAAIRRIQTEATETQELGATTLEELYAQRQQLDRIHEEGERVQGQLSRAERLQDILSVWSLKFNRGAARKQAQNAREYEEERERIRKDRQQRQEDEAQRAMPTVAEEEEPEVIVTPHGRRRWGSGKKRVGSITKTAHYNTNRDLENNPYKNELQELRDNDAEIEQELGAVGDQLDELLYMAETMGAETKAQGKGLDEFADKMDNVNHKQRVVNNRTGRFMEGGLRRKYEREGATNVTGFW